MWNKDHWRIKFEAVLEMVALVLWIWHISARNEAPFVQTGQYSFPFMCLTLHSPFQSPLQLTQREKTKIVGRIGPWASCEAREQCSVAAWHLTDRLALLDNEGQGIKLKILINTCILALFFQPLLGNLSTYNRFMAWRWEKVPGTSWVILLLCKNLAERQIKY